MFQIMGVGHVLTRYEGRAGSDVGMSHTHTLSGKDQNKSCNQMAFKIVKSISKDLKVHLRYLHSMHSIAHAKTTHRVLFWSPDVTTWARGSSRLRALIAARLVSTRHALII